MMSKTVGLLLAFIGIAIIIGFTLNLLRPSAEMSNKASIGPEFQAMELKAKEAIATGGIGISERDYQTIRIFADAMEKCKEDPVPCVFAHSELLTPDMINAVKNAKVDKRILLLVTQLKGKVMMWKTSAGSLSGESCAGDCASAFYSPFEHSGLSIEFTPFSITKTLYQNRDIVTDFFCDGDLNNCPSFKTCMDCYRVYMEKGQDSINDLLNMNCHEACFLVAKTIDMTASGNRFVPV